MICNGLISLRANGHFGVICTQCHRLITNKGVKSGNEMSFKCQKCSSDNRVLAKDVLEEQDTTWRGLWDNKITKDIVFDKYGNPKRGN